MSARRLHRLLARLALAWFALALGAAAASPLVQPRAMQLVCSASGAVMLLVDTGDGLAEAGHATLDCALCLPADAPPARPPAVRLPSSADTPRRAAPHVPALVVAQAGAPLPARGPPPY